MSVIKLVSRHRPTLCLICISYWSLLAFFYAMSRNILLWFIKTSLFCHSKNCLHTIRHAIVIVVFTVSGVLSLVSDVLFPLFLMFDDIYDDVRRWSIRWINTTSVNNVSVTMVVTVKTWKQSRVSNDTSQWRRRASGQRETIKHPSNPVVVGTQLHHLRRYCLPTFRSYIVELCDCNHWSELTTHCFVYWLTFVLFLCTVVTLCAILKT